MRRTHVLAVCAILLGGMASLASLAAAIPFQPAGAPEVASVVVPAQMGPGGMINPGRDCQTVRQCRFTPGGLYRGCISAYSCRVCRFVESRCQVIGRERTCRSLRCDWG
jgi:hypothetical protein